MTNNLHKLQSNLSHIHSRIQASCFKANRAIEDIRWVAISKYHSLEMIQLALTLGLHEFGENYTHELEEKAPHHPELSWVFTGQLQSNKILKIMKHAKEIQTVTSFKHAKKISETANILNRKDYPIFIQVNVENETTKSGLSWNQAYELARQLESLSHLKLQGVMAIPPRKWDHVSLYKETKERSLGVGNGLLSIGMSQDLELAIEGGSDCLRLGTSLFGPRP
ncbi:MAG: YggS family pyridoxal phosphate-dependent enzyme [Oligoflexales bacterium]